MIWCRFQRGDVAGYGRVTGDIVTAIEGEPWDAHRLTEAHYPLDDVKLLVPVIPGTFYCAGANYREHIEKRAALQGVPVKIRSKPSIGYRANSALIAHNEAIIKPAGAGDHFEYEGELVAVIGKTGKNISKEAALDYVFGWTIGNDVSERDWQDQDGSNLYRSKNSDTFKPMGPWIVTGLDPNEMTTTVRLNGDVVDRFVTGNMICDTAAYIAEISKTITLHPGDVIWLGTDGWPCNMVPGDVCEVEISGIGVLRNPIAAETASG
jgi:2-keto-4-pentenoate hydratase/2-oxohepta-3-ene-1,7-dioic acid hydratase in catechol pathway